MTKHTPWQIVEEHIYETFKIFQIRRSSRINPRTGKRFDFFLMDGLDWVNIIPLTNDNQIVLVKQLRHGSGSVTFEIPGGCVEKGEEPQLSALRELREETGYTLPSNGSCEALGTVYPNPAMQAMKCHCFLAKGVALTTSTELDPGEDIEVVLKPLSDIQRMIASGEISHSIVLSAFALYFSKQVLR